MKRGRKSKREQALKAIQKLDGRWTLTREIALWAGLPVQVIARYLTEGKKKGLLEHRYVKRNDTTLCMWRRKQ